MPATPPRQAKPCQMRLECLHVAESKRCRHHGGTKNPAATRLTAQTVFLKGWVLSRHLFVPGMSAKPRVGGMQGRMAACACIADRPKNDTCHAQNPYSKRDAKTGEDAKGVPQIPSNAQQDRRGTKTNDKDSGCAQPHDPMVIQFAFCHRCICCKNWRS